MLEECGLPYTLIPVDISKGDQFKPEFLKISPNNRMPAIVDPDGPGGRPISVFESGAILQYLGRKTGKFYPKDERARVEVDQWLMWQMGGLGPMAGQAHHFRLYAPEQLPYAIDRYTNECHRLYGVMNKRLADRPFLAGSYSIADIACVGWASRHERQGQDFGGISASQALARNRHGAAGGQEGNEPAGRSGSQGRYARSGGCRRFCSASARADEKGARQVLRWLVRRKAERLAKGHSRRVEIERAKARKSAEKPDLRMFLSCVPRGHTADIHTRFIAILKPRFKFSRQCSRVRTKAGRDTCKSPLGKSGHATGDYDGSFRNGRP